mgnify:CR=1 FL=1
MNTGVRLAKLALATLLLMTDARAGPPLTDFTDAATVDAFRVLNDGVMGGASTSSLRTSPEGMIFDGAVSLANNGGFASCRGPLLVPMQATRLLLTVRGDGQRYRLTLRADDAPGTPLYQASFVAPREWQTLRFENGDFAASFRGRPVTAPLVRFSDMHFVGILIADGQAGPFRIELKTLAAEPPADLRP